MSVFEGFLDTVQDRLVSGWARNVDDEGDVVLVAVWTDKMAKPVYTRASIYRKDLEDAGRGTGRYGFEVTLSEQYADRVHAKVFGADDELTGSPVHLSADAAIVTRDLPIHRAILRSAASHIVQQMLLDR